MKRGLRIALTLAIVVMIASQVDLSVVRNLAERVAPLWLGAALAVLFGVRVLVAWRFKVLLGALGIDRSFGSLLQVTLVSNALGQMLPTGIGQDVIRGHHVVRSHGRGVDVSATIIQERLVGIGSMLVVGLIASLLWLEGPLQVWTASGIVAVGGVFLGAFAVARSWSRRGGELPAFLRLPERARGVLIDVVYAVADTGRLGPVFAFVFIISLGVQLARCVVFWCLYAALGSPVSLVHMFAFVPLVFLLTSLPISLAGIGVREAALIALVGQLGIGAEVNVAAGVAFQLLVLVMLLPGLVLYGVRGLGPPGPSPEQGERVALSSARTPAKP